MKSSFAKKNGDRKKNTKEISLTDSIKKVSDKEVYQLVVIIILS